MGILRIRSSEMRTDEEVEVHAEEQIIAALKEHAAGAAAIRLRRTAGGWDPASPKVSPPRPTSEIIRRVWGTPPGPRYGAAAPFTLARHYSSDWRTLSGPRYGAAAPFILARRIFDC